MKIELDAKLLDVALLLERRGISRPVFVRSVHVTECGFWSDGELYNTSLMNVMKSSGLDIIVVNLPLVPGTDVF